MKHANDNQNTIAMALPVMEQKDVDRFWSKVQIGGQDECWPWCGAVGNSGHGRFKVAGKLYSPHRIAFGLTNGDIENVDEFHVTVIRHKCDNPPCCNPSHLEPGRQADNVIDMEMRGRSDRARGEASGKAKLTSDVVRIIRESPLSSRKLAAELGIVSHGTIRQIRRGEAWTHIANDNANKTKAA